MLEGLCRLHVSSWEQTYATMVPDSRKFGKTTKFYDKCHRHKAHQSNGAAENAVFTVRGLARTYLAVIKGQNRVFRREAGFTNVAVDHQARCVGSHQTQRAQRHTFDAE